ncbi:MAG: HAD-IA family hydrolase [Spirochaeta sp.]|nr:HAD-IA family hydrolase [Spirochaeta sp.]
MIRGVFFDLYGTLFIYGDMKKAWTDWLHHFHKSLREHGLTLSKEDFAGECDGFFGKDEPASTERNQTVFEKRIGSLCSSLGIKVCDKHIGSIADLIADKWQEEIEIDQDAIPVLRELKENRILGLVSNFDHPRHVRRYLSKYGLDYLFETIIISGEVGLKKPDPNIFKLALSATGLTPGEVAYVGDTDVDVKAANEAGIMPIMINRRNKNTGDISFDFENETNAKPINKHGYLETECKTIFSLQELLSL